MLSRRHLSTVLLLMAGVITPALAQIPRTISFQGVLADASGVLVPDGPQDLTISIYESATGGTAIFSETQRVTVVRGVFNAIIGSSDPAGIPTTVSFDKPYFLGVKVGTAGVELSPRTPFTSVPYALNAAVAQVARTADTASWAMVADSAARVTGGHVISVNGQQGAVEFLGAGSTTVTRSGNQFIIRSTDTSGGSGIRRIDNFDGSLVIDPPTGPFVTMFIREGGIQTHHYRDQSLSLPKIMTTGANALEAIIFDGTRTVWGNPAPGGPAGGDLTGTYPNPEIAPDAVTTAEVLDNTILTDDIADLTILTQDLADTSVTAAKIWTEGAPDGSALMSNGTGTPFWGNPVGGNIPFEATVASDTVLWSLTNTGNEGAGYFAVDNPASIVNALTGITNGFGSGVYGMHEATTGTSAGVLGESNSEDANAAGVMGVITSTSPGGFSSAVRGINNGTGGLGIGVYGSQSGSGWGVYGEAPTGIGVHGNSASGFGLYGLSQSGTGVYGQSSDGTGIAGVSTTANGVSGTSTDAIGVSGTSTNGYGVFGTSETSHAGVFDITNAASTGDAVRATNMGLGRGVYAEINNTSNIVAALRGQTNGGGYGVFGQATGNGNAGFFQISNPASTSSTMNVTTNGIGSGITVQLTNASNGARGIDVLQAGVGPGVFATSAGGNAVWGITSSISAAGVIGDNTFGEAVVGRNRGGNGVGAVVGRNDSSGYGVRGFNTKDGIGVLGQAGISGGTGVGGRFENVNAANGNDALQAATNGTGWAGNFTNANNSSASRGVRISTTANQGGNALTIANGTVSLSREIGYGGGVVDDAILTITVAGAMAIPTGPPLVDGATIWVVNASGGAVQITNTSAGAYNIAPGLAQQFLYVTAHTANWIPVQ